MQIPGPSTVPEQVNFGNSDSPTSTELGDFSWSDFERCVFTLWRTKASCLCVLKSMVCMLSYERPQSVRLTSECQAWHSDVACIRAPVCPWISKRMRANTVAAGVQIWCYRRVSPGGARSGAGCDVQHERNLSRPISDSVCRGAPPHEWRGPCAVRQHCQHPRQGVSSTLFQLTLPVQLLFHTDRAFTCRA